MNKDETKVDLSTFKLTFSGRFFYALGDFGYNFMYYWLSTYLMIYYTDTIGIPAAIVSFMMLVIRIFDAVNDPIIGSLADRTRTRWGRYRPWFLFGSIAMAICISAIFAASPQWAYESRLIYMWVVYILLTIASTCSNMPYGALNGCITPDTEDRAKVSGLRMMFANTSSMITVIIAVPLMLAFSSNGTANDARGYFWAVLITCLLGLPTMILSAIKTKEVLTPPPSQTSIPIKAQMHSLVKNKPIIILIIGQFLLGCILYGRAAMLSYYWQYNGGNAALATTYGIIGLVAAIIGTGWFGIWLFKKMQHKGKACAALNFIGAAAYVWMYFVTPASTMFWVLTFISSCVFYAYMAVHFGAIGDAVDYGEYISRVRCDGFLASFISVGNKAGGAVLPAIGAAVLAYFNYVPNVEQPADTLNVINWFITLIPAILSIINGLNYLGYSIDTSKHKTIMKELIDRRA